MVRLRGTSPDQPGWTRRRAGRGFVYLDAAGERLPDEEADRVRALVLVAALVPEPDRPYRDRMRAERDLMVSGYDAEVRRGPGVSTYWPDGRTVADGLYRGVADELDAVAEHRRQVGPALPIVLGQPVFDRHNRIAGA